MYMQYVDYEQEFSLARPVLCAVCCMLYENLSCIVVHLVGHDLISLFRASVSPIDLLTSRLQHQEHSDVKYNHRNQPHNHKNHKTTRTNNH